MYKTKEKLFHENGMVSVIEKRLPYSLLNALGVYIFLLILGWASIGEGR